MNYLHLCFASLLSLSFFTVSNAQTTLILQPGADAGKDTRVNSLDFYTTGSSPEMPVSKWTFNGQPGIDRALLEFNLAEIPVNSYISKAELYLFGEPGLASGGHSTLSGSNEIMIQRITSPWQEHEVTWGTQPTVSSDNQIITTESFSDYEDMMFDVTQLVQDMVNDPTNSFGFRLKQLTEVYYRRMNFCTSDHPDNSQHPKLVITYYKSINSISQTGTSESFKIYPNPAKQELYISNTTSPFNHLSVVIFNTQGQIQFQSVLNGETDKLDISNLSNGHYTVKVTTQNGVETKQFVKL